MNFPVCQLCEAAPASCRAHIIPKQFYKRIRGTEKHLYELHVEEEVNRGFTQSGIWEQGILCPNCDGKLGVFDQYAYEVLPETIQSASIIEIGPDTSVCALGCIDAEKFRMFLVALLWRASRATHEMFKFIEIGPYEERFKHVLIGKDMSSLARVDCAIVLFRPPRYDKLILPPYHTRYDGVNVIQFFLYPWKLVIKLDNRPFGGTFRQLALQPGRDAHALVMLRYSQGEMRLLADLQGKIKRHEAIGTD